METIEKLARFVVETKFDSIPHDTIDLMNRLTLKTVAGMLAGSISVSGRKFLRSRLRYHLQQEAGVYGCGFRTSIEDAVLTNGYFAHASELEDNYYPGCTSDITIVPVAFPVGEWLKLSGEEILEACFVGYEIQARLGYYTYPRTEEMGIEAISYFGAFGAAAAAAKALGLNTEETENALGLALTRSGGYIMNHGTDAHYLDTAWACRNGINAALLAREGVTGPWSMEKWLRDLMGAQNVKIDEITEGLGKPPYFVHNIWFKKYPCCFETHRQIDALSTLIRENKLKSEDISKVEVHCGPVDGSCDRAELMHVEDSKFSYQHVLSAVMLEGEITMDTFTERKLKDSKYHETRRKVNVSVHNDWPMTEMSGIGSVDVTLKNGKVLTRGMEQPIGGPKLPLTTEQVVGLFEKYAQPVLSENQARIVQKFILDLQKLQDLSELTQILTYSSQLRAAGAH